MRCIPFLFMEVESRIDALAGLYNRRGFDELFSRMGEGPGHGQRQRSKAR